MNPENKPRAVAVRMLVVDLDGTLLTSAGELSWRDRRAIQDVRRSGISITLASARPPAGMRHIIEELGIGDVDVIAYSGALATLSRAGSGQHQVVDARMSPDVARSILERAIDAGIACWWYSGDFWYVRAYDEMARYEAELTHMSPVPIGDHSLPAPHKLLATGIPGEVRRQLEALRDHAVAMGASSQFSNPHSLEIVAEGVNKAVALQRLTEARGISLSDVVAIGDGPNDAEMLRVAGYAVAMANSAPETVQVADRVTGTNDEDGVADAIARLGLDRRRSIDTNPV